MNINQITSSMVPFQSSVHATTIQEASQQFEALLFRQFLGKAMKPVFKSSLLGENNATDTYRSMLVDTFSQTIASTHPLHLDQLFTSAKNEK